MERDHMVEMKIFGLAVDEETKAPVLILKDADEGRTLPIWIGNMEAMSITVALNEVELPRPLSHDLILTLVEQLGAALRDVEVHTLDKGTYHAMIRLKTPDGELRVDSRPSDAIAVAVRAGVPILVDEQVLEEAAVSGELFSHISGTPELKNAEAKQWTEVLEQFDPDDDTYEM